MLVTCPGGCGKRARLRVRVEGSFLVCYDCRGTWVVSGYSITTTRDGAVHEIRTVRLPAMEER